MEFFLHQISIIQMIKLSIKKYSAFILSLLFILSIWGIFSKIIDSELILPSPKIVLTDCIIFIKQKIFWINFFYTCVRCFSAFIISIITGVLLGILCGKSEFFKYFMEIPVSILRTTPVIAIILISLYWLNSNSLPIFISILMNLPITITAVTKGFENIDQNQLNMAKIYYFTNIQKLIYIQLPAALNNLKSACISCFGLCWKVVVAGEVLCLPKKGLGTLMQFNQVHLETSCLIALTILLVLLSWIIEKILIKLAGLIWKK